MQGLFNIYGKESLTDEVREQAFDNMYIIYYNELYQFAYHYVMSDYAEDIVQEVFIRLYERGHKIRKGETIKSYLFTAVKNGCIDYLRKMKIDDSKKVKLLEVYTYADEYIDDDSELIDKIHNIIKELPEKQQQIIKLKFEGKDYNEIAELLNISPSTVNVHITRAYKTIRGKLYIVIQIFYL